MRIAIHQPNFVPWRPFFAKMAAVDVLVLLTRCQFSREHYQHRFRFQDRWYTLGVTDIKHPAPIREKQYANPADDWAAIKRRLPKHRAWFEQFDDMVSKDLCMTNTRIIFEIRRQLGIATEVSFDPPTTLTGTDRLIEICRLFPSPVTYLAGRSGGNYMDSDKFKAAGIEVEFQTVNDTRHVFES